MTKISIEQEIARFGAAHGFSRSEIEVSAHFRMLARQAFAMVERHKIAGRLSLAITWNKVGSALLERDRVGESYRELKATIRALRLTS